MDDKDQKLEQLKKMMEEWIITLDEYKKEEDKIVNYDNIKADNKENIDNLIEKWFKKFELWEYREVIQICNQILYLDKDNILIPTIWQIYSYYYLWEYEMALNKLETIEAIEKKVKDNLFNQLWLILNLKWLIYHKIWDKNKALNIFQNNANDNAYIPSIFNQYIISSTTLTFSYKENIKLLDELFLQYSKKYPLLLSNNDFCEMFLYLYDKAFWDSRIISLISSAVSQIQWEEISKYVSERLKRKKLMKEWKWTEENEKKYNEEVAKIKEPDNKKIYSKYSSLDYQEYFNKFIPSLNWEIFNRILHSGSKAFNFLNGKYIDSEYERDFNKTYFRIKCNKNSLNGFCDNEYENKYKNQQVYELWYTYWNKNIELLQNIPLYNINIYAALLSSNLDWIAPNIALEYYNKAKSLDWFEDNKILCYIKTSLNRYDEALKIAIDEKYDEEKIFILEKLNKYDEIIKIYDEKINKLKMEKHLNWYWEELAEILDKKLIILMKTDNDIKILELYNYIIKVYQDSEKDISWYRFLNNFKYKKDELYYKKAIILKKLSRFQETIDTLTELLKINPNHTDAELLRNILYKNI